MIDLITEKIALFEAMASSYWIFMEFKQKIILLDSHASVLEHEPYVLYL